MGKFFKTCLIIGVVCILAGIGLSGAGIFNGGLDKLKEEVLNGEWSFGEGDIKPFFELEQSEYFNEEEIVNIDVSSMESTFQAAEIKKLYVKGAGVSIEITEHDGEEFFIKEDNVQQFQTYEDGEKLYVIARNKNVQTTEGHVVISVPASVYESGKLETELMLAACAVNLNQMNVKELDIKISAGAIESTAVTIQDLKLEMTAGAVDLVLTGSASDYNYDVECTTGSVKIGGQSIEGLAQTFEQDNDAPRNVDIECAVGAVTIAFEE